MKPLPTELTTVTRTSKCVALLVFITLPIVAFYVGWQYGTMATYVEQIDVNPPPSTNLPTPEIPNPDTPTNPDTPISTAPGNSGGSDPYPGNDTVIIPPTTNTSCGVTNCHGTTVTCGDVSDPIACTMEYRIGDFCRRYVSCEFVRNSCTAVKDTRYSTCVSCVEKCTSENPENAFMCEDKCRASLE